MASTNDPIAVPAWLMDAWESGQRKHPDESGSLTNQAIRMYKQARKNFEILEDPSLQEGMSAWRLDKVRSSWFLWEFYSLLAQIGWQTVREEVLRASESQTETNRG